VKLNKRVAVYVILCNMASKKSQPAKPNYQGSLADYKASVKKSGNSTPGPIISAPTVYGAKNVVQNTGQVIKNSAIDAATMVAGGVAGRVLGKVLSNVAGRVVGKEVFETLAPRTIGTGGKVSKTYTPMGPTLRSTRIMTQGQTAAAGKGLTKIASNRANEVGSQIGSKVAAGTRTATRGAATLGIALNDTKVKNKKDTRKK
jgi:hypothetical protein